MDLTTIAGARLPGVTHAIHLDGLGSINGGPDVACCAVAISLTALSVRAAAPVKFLDAVVLQLPQVGIVEAVVAEVFDGGFDLTFDSAPQSKLGTFVAWLESAGEPDETGGREERDWERIVPIKRLTTLKRWNVPPSLVRIVDLSRSGVAFTTSKPLFEGEYVRVGALRGRVIRRFDGGGAVKFHRLIDAKDFDVMIDLDAAASSDQVA